MPSLHTSRLPLLPGISTLLIFIIPLSGQNTGFIYLHPVIMKKALLIFSFILLTIIIICGISWLTDKRTYASWEVNSKHNNPGIAWAPFEWGGSTLNGKYYDKAFMNIPCRVKGIGNACSFQFDLGATLTGVYENTFSGLHASDASLKQRIKRLRSPLQFWNRNKYFDDLELQFGDYMAVNKTAFVYKNYGGQPGNIQPSDTVHLGTVGSDLFRNKILLIDYPNRRFAICDTMPAGYSNGLVNIELDNYGRVILPMKIHDSVYRVLFDNGSSIFPIITAAKNISKFSIAPDSDSITISSWGNKHTVTGKMITDSFELAGLHYANVKVYANHSGYGIDNNTDGMAGNALFWNRIMVIDFRNKKFGLQ